MSTVARCLLACAFAFAMVALAQPAARVHKVGVLTVGDIGHLRNALRDLGYVEGRNLAFEVRVSTGDPEELGRLAGDLVRARVDLIVAAYPGAAFAAKAATSTIPIVLVNAPDPVQLGIVKSLAKPEGNVTGTTSLSVELSLKQLQILKQALPRASRVAVLTNPGNPWHPLVIRDLGADYLGLRLRIIELREPSQFDAAFARIKADRTDAIVVLADPMLHSPDNRKRLAALALQHQLPSIGGLRGWAEAGGMLSYWADEADLFRRVASYVDRILKGARVGDLPIEQPREYELVVNQQTVKGLGVTIPPDLLRGAKLVGV